jgi:Flp pilus assembly protein TadD
MKRIVLILFLAAASFGAAPRPAMELRVDRLASALKLLTDGDRRVVEETIELIKSGNNGLALARLSSLNASNPENSSLRILTAYAQLQLGNLFGALQEGKKAEGSPNGNSYKCYFMAKLALFTGDRAACQRELQHVKSVGDMQAEAKQLEKDLKKPSGSM